MIKVVLPALILTLTACSVLVEQRKEGSCSIKEDPTGAYGKLEVQCPDVSFLLKYDNSPDGRDGIILGIEGTESQKLSEKKQDPYIVKTGSYETLTGWAYEEVWKVGSYELRAFEYYVNGGATCYEEEEATQIKLYRNGEVITLLDFFWEETDCGGN